MTDMLCAIRMLLIVESIVLVSAKSAHVNLVELAIVPHYTIAYLFLKYCMRFFGPAAAHVQRNSRPLAVALTTAATLGCAALSVGTAFSRSEWSDPKRAPPAAASKNWTWRTHRGAADRGVLLG